MSTTVSRNFTPLSSISTEDASIFTVCWTFSEMYSKTCVKRPLSKRPKIGLQHQLSLNAGKKYCRMLQVKSISHSAILSTFKLSIVTKIFVLSIYECPFYTRNGLHNVTLNSRTTKILKHHIFYNIKCLNNIPLRQPPQVLHNLLA